MPARRATATSRRRRTRRSRTACCASAAIIKTELEASGASVALVARSGLDLRPLRPALFARRPQPEGQPRHTLGGAPALLRLRRAPAAPVRPGPGGLRAGQWQSPSLGYVSVLLLPPAAAAAAGARGAGQAVALQLLAADYSANAYPFSQRYQNCNQWVAELLASRLGRRRATATPRRRAGAGWLPSRATSPRCSKSAGCADVAGRLPPLAAPTTTTRPRTSKPQRYRVSMPASIEAFVQRRVPGTTRLEFCHAEHRSGACAAAGAADRRRLPGPGRRRDDG